jgi:hypothetical protein
MISVSIDFRKFDPVVTDLLSRVAPERAREAVTRVARAIARELRAASPVGGSPNAARMALRAKGAYAGPLRRGWRTAAAKENARSFRFSSRRRYQLPPDSAAVFVKTFYARFVEFGTNPGRYRVRNTVGKALRSYRYHPRGHPPHPFVQPVMDRAGSIAEAEIKRFLG